MWTAVIPAKHSTKLSPIISGAQLPTNRSSQLPSLTASVGHLPSPARTHPAGYARPPCLCAQLPIKVRMGCCLRAWPIIRPHCLDQLSRASARCPHDTHSKPTCARPA
ncbi:hypothetical protein Salat_0884900 [Sesamum alatum]|uniref:Uncharacterized protein n=1 Tax=Sesamum alatum TaxID=300844 RepID=A0AAE1YJN0_9LAMI|nr:hypothetical protein Salat_0884900 [Sesamum alatum]